MPPTLEDAIGLAARLHKGQKDKAGKPYILHILRVATSRRLTTERQRILAALHDTKEDCGLSDQKLGAMGYDASIIADRNYLTKLPEEEHDYGAFIKRVASGPLDAILVKLADLDDNADLTRFEKPSEADRKRAKKYRTAIDRLEFVFGERHIAASMRNT